MNGSMDLDTRPDDVIDMTPTNREGEVVFESASAPTPQPPWLVKLKFWGLAAIGIGIGVAFFLFFLTFLLYVVLPLTAILILWNLIRGPRSHRPG